MTTLPNAPEAKSKRTDVGYKRPPVEHRFKKGQKPPPRKAKATSAKLSPIEILQHARWKSAWYRWARSA